MLDQTECNLVVSVVSSGGSRIVWKGGAIVNKLWRNLVGGTGWNPLPPPPPPHPRKILNI